MFWTPKRAMKCEFFLNLIPIIRFYFSFHLIHPEQADIEEADYNICGFVPISDNVGFAIERTDEVYGDYYLRKITFTHDGSFEKDDEPRILAFDVKCLTVCYDFQLENNEFHVILRQAPIG